MWQHLYRIQTSSCAEIIYSKFILLDEIKDHTSYTLSEPGTVRSLLDLELQPNVSSLAVSLQHGGDQHSIVDDAQHALGQDEIGMTQQTSVQLG